MTVWLAIPLLGLAMLAACGETKQPGPRHDGSPTPRPSNLAREAPIPVAKLAIEPIRMADAERNDLMGVGCTFVAKGSPDTDWAVVTGDGDAHIKRGGALVKFTADETTRDMGYMAREIYQTDGLSMQLAYAPGEPKTIGNEGEERAGSVIIRDASGETVWRAEGTFNCGA